MTPTYWLQNHCLSASIACLVYQFHSSTTWRTFGTSFYRFSYLSPTVGDIQHPVALLLHLWMTKGVPVHTSNPPWLASDTHRWMIPMGLPSICNQAFQFLWDELTTFINNGFWMVLVYGLARHPLLLQLSPTKVKLECDHWLCLICDHT